MVPPKLVKVLSRNRSFMGDTVISSKEDTGGGGGVGIWTNGRNTHSTTESGRTDGIWTNGQKVNALIQF